MKFSKRKWWLILLVIPIVPLLYLAYLQLLFELRLGSLRAEGEPTSIADVEGRAIGSVDVDCTSLWQQAMQAYSEDWGRLSEEERKSYLTLTCVDCGEPIPKAGTAWPEWPVAIRCLQSQTRSLDLCKEATKKGGKAWLPRDRGNYDFGMLQRSGDFRMLCWLTELQGVVELYQKQSEKAVQSIDGLFALARAIENQPTVYGTLYTNKYEQASYRLIFELCSQENVSPETLQRFQKYVASQDLLMRFRRGLIEDRAFAIEIYMRPISLAVTPYWSERMGYLDALDELIQRFDEGWPQAIRYATVDHRPAMGPLTELAIDSYLILFQGVARVETNRRMTIVALAARPFIAARGKPPNSIDELIPEYLPTRPTDIWGNDTTQITTDDHQLIVTGLQLAKQTEEKQLKSELIRLTFEVLLSK